MRKPERARLRKKKPKRSPPPQLPPVPRLALSIRQFCTAIGISEAKYFELKSRGRGPVEMHVSRRVLITPEAAADWRRQCETPAP
jgi:hypothetical protein